MKKGILILLILSMLCLPAVSAAAPKIVDIPLVLSEAQRNDLEATAQDLSKTYNMDVVIVLANGLGSKSPRDYADDYFNYNGYGIGPDYSGVLFLLDLKSRQWWISTCGQGIDAFTDEGIQQLFDHVSWFLSKDLYYEALDAYLIRLEDYLVAYQNGAPLFSYASREKGPVDYWIAVVISLLIGAGVGGITIFFMRRGMNTARAQADAGDYVVSGSYDLQIERNMFLYSRTSRTRRESSSGGSSTHRSSSGRSHGGGGGRF